MWEEHYIYRLEAIWFELFNLQVQVSLINLCCFNFVDISPRVHLKADKLRQRNS